MLLSVESIAWKIAFWLTVALTVLPFPFKIHGYVTGQDQSPVKVKVDELSAVALTWIGLLAFFGFVYGKSFLFPEFWYAWIAIMAGFTVTGPLWSPKLAYAKEVLGEKTYQVVFWSSIVIYLPMFCAVYLYARAT